MGTNCISWTLLVGVLIFGLGGGMSIVTGVVHIAHHSAPEAFWWTYAVLAAATVFEAGSWYFGYRPFAQSDAAAASS